MTYGKQVTVRINGRPFPAKYLEKADQAVLGSDLFHWVEINGARSLVVVDDIEPETP